MWRLLIKVRDTGKVLNKKDAKRYIHEKSILVEKISKNLELLDD